MGFAQQDKERWMSAALAEARRAHPVCLPNPPVGCVLVSDGVVVARGYTEEPGRHHAEAMALARLVQAENLDRLGQDARAYERLAAFVTLEPCSFFGRTPSCARALVARGVTEVYVGILDPHPRNRGAGIEILRAAGIAVEMGILRDEIRAQVEPYLIRG